ncbi:DmsC/YnfH family molybdoenzyme membrane anchor subunit [Rubneribacter badeniensis]|uniref:DmsC/YnfH family molybdoenzyme membrane anchor subunit n=1 Tax=Rubneribacter badeniensis TaxID=2070688 RepID=UPI003A94E399
MISEFPLFLFATLGGLTAGAYAASALLPSIPALAQEGARERGVGRPWLLPLVCLALLGAGLLGVLGHLGRPERFLLALSNPTSMIAEEAYWSIALGLLVLVDLVLSARKGAPSRAVRVLAAVCALVLMCIMGWAYFTAYGNPAWAAWPTLPLFVAGDLAMGTALVGLLDETRWRTGPFVAVSVALSLVAACSALVVGVQFSGLGHEVGFFVASALALALSSAFAIALCKGAVPEKAARLLAFCLAFGGVAASRWAFYAASIL